MSMLAEAKAVIELLNKKGYEAYLVGGYVRDYILKRHSGDIDIATDALPEEVAALFSKTINTGLKHGTVTVISNQYPFEVTTFREDSVYIDHRKPEQVIFIKSLQEDVLRRDFTMNALAMTKEEEIIDYVNGIQDIHNQIIQTVGDPFLRFHEDALRMLRAFRFVSSLGFKIEENSKIAIKENAHLIQNVSLERIINEFEKMIKGEHFSAAIKEMIDTDFHRYLPFLEKGLINCFKTNFKPHDLLEFLSMIAVSDSYEQVEQLPVPNFIKKEVKIIYNMFEIELKEFTKPLLFRNGLRNCLIVNQLNVHLRNEMDQSEQIINNFNSLPIHKQCDLTFKGDQIIEFYNRTPGGWIAEILDEICLKVILGELENDYEQIKNYLIAKSN